MLPLNDFGSFYNIPKWDSILADIYYPRQNSLKERNQIKEMESEELKQELWVKPSKPMM